MSRERTERSTSPPAASGSDPQGPAEVGSPERLRRLLVISYHYPPDGAVGGLRWAGLSKYLARHGWEVHVITAAVQDGAAVVEGVHVHTCVRARTLNDVYNEFAERRRSGSGADGDGGDGGTTTGSSAVQPGTPRRLSLGALLRREIGASLVFPDYARGWILRAASKARRLLREMPFDAVVTSGPPHSAHIAGVLATLGRPGLLHVDLRDPWSALSHKAWSRRLYGSLLSYLLIPRLEGLVFWRASSAIANTSEFAGALRTAYPGLSVAFLSNGIDLERLPPRTEEPFSGVSIAYVGTLYLGRDLSPVLDATKQFLDRVPEAAGKVRIRVAGHLVGVHEQRFRQQVSARGLEDVVDLLGVIPGAEALSLLNRSHLAVVLAQNQQVQIPAKLYECMGLQIPTLVVTESTSAAAREAERIGGIVHEATDVDGISQVIEELWSGVRPARSLPVVDISYEGLAAEMGGLLLTPPDPMFERELPVELQES